MKKMILGIFFNLLLIPMLYAGYLTDIFTGLVGRDGDKIQSYVLNNACLLTASLKNRIIQTLKRNSSNYAVSTQFGFSQVVADRFKYGGVGIDASILTQFLNTNPSGSLTVICPFPLKGHFSSTLSFSYCTDDSGGGKAYINASQ